MSLPHNHEWNCGSTDCPRPRRIMTNETTASEREAELAAAHGRLASFVREHLRGGCRILSQGSACECALCDADRLYGAASAALPAPADQPPSQPSVEEGCTPADAKMLRRANHALAAESHALQEVVAELYSQIKKFAAEQGEADFYTGRALAILCKTRPMEYRWPFTNKPDDVLADIWSNADAAVAQADQSASDNSEQDQPKGCHECAWGKVAGCWRCADHVRKEAQRLIDAVDKLGNARAFLRGWQGSDHCKRNAMVEEVGRWIEGISELYRLEAVARAAIAKGEQRG